MHTTTYLADGAGPLQPLIDWIDGWRTGAIILGALLLGLFVIFAAVKGGFKAAMHNKEGARETVSGLGVMILCAAVMGFGFMMIGIGLKMGKASGTDQQRQQVEQQIKNGNFGDGIG